MPLNVREKSGSDFKKVPEGTHIAVCNMVVDLGLQPSPYGPKHRIFFRWEIPDERTEWEKDGQTMEGPMTIGTTLSASLSKKATLRGFLESWRGKQFTKEELEGFDVFAVLGKSCQLQVIHEKADNGNVYANIKGCMSLPKGLRPPQAENPLLRYSPDEPGDYNKLPEWLRTKIDNQVSETPEDKNPPPIHPQDPGFQDDDLDSVPF